MHIEVLFEVLVITSHARAAGPPNMLMLWDTGNRQVRQIRRCAILHDVQAVLHSLLAHKRQVQPARDVRAAIFLWQLAQRRRGFHQNDAPDVSWEIEAPRLQAALLTSLPLLARP